MSGSKEIRGEREGNSAEKKDERKFFCLGEISAREKIENKSQKISYFVLFFSLVRRFSKIFKESMILEEERGTWEIFIPCFLGLGVLFYLLADHELSWVTLIGTSILQGVLCFLSRKKAIIFYCLAGILLLFLGALSAKFETFRMGTKTLGSAVSTQLTGHIIEIEKLASGGKRLLVDVIRTKNPKLYYQPKRVRLRLLSKTEEIIPGSFITGRVRLLPPAGPFFPGGHDFSFYSFFRGIGANGFFLGSPEVLGSLGELIHKEKVPFSQKILAKFNEIRNRVASRIRSQISDAEGEIAAALLVGVRAGTPERVNELLRRTGLAHILSISGLHLALVAGSVMWAMRCIFAFFPLLSSRWPVKKYAAGVALIVISFYLLLSGLEVAAQRSFIMLAIMLIALMFDRAALTMRNVAIAATVILLISPHEIVHIGFQMSFGATIFLIGFYQLLRDFRKKEHPKKLFVKLSLVKQVISKSVYALGAVAFTSLTAGIGSGIYAAWKFQHIALLGVISNVIVAPAVGFVIMPSGLLSMIAMPFGLDWPFLQLMGKGLSFMLVISEYLSSLIPFEANVRISTYSVIILTIGFLFFLLATTRIRLVGLPFIFSGFLFFPAQGIPDVLISENASMIALKGEEGKIFLNRKRTNSLILKVWQKTLKGSEIIKPFMCQKEDSLFSSGKEDSFMHQCQETRQYLQGKDKFEGFICTEDLCILKNSKGIIIGITKHTKAAKALCKEVDLMIVQDSSYSESCEGRASVITARDLALSGSAGVYFDMDANKQVIRIEYAVTTPLRPWHFHRQFSREARGLPTFQSKKPLKNKKT